MSNQNTLNLGDWNAICEICGFKFKASELHKNWKNQYVCKKDFEHRHPMDFLKSTPDDPTVPWARPEADDAGGTDVDGETLPPTYTFTPEPPPDGDNNGDL